MATVTDIREQVRNPRRRSVFVDGEYAFSMTADELLEHRISVGASLTPERLEALVGEIEVRRARESLLRLLGYRARSESELRAHLRQKQVPEAVAERAMADLRRMGLIDDRQFAEAWVRGRLAGRAAGRKRLAWELRARGVAGPVVEQSLAEIGEETEFSVALDLAQRRQERLRDEEPEAQRRKLASFLQRRGFSYETIDKVLSNILPPE